MSEKTAEQIAADKLAKEQAKADRAVARSTAKADRDAAKAKAKADAAAAKQAKRDAKVAEKLAAKNAKAAANDQPVQNEVRRPKAGTKCGQAWSVFDAISTELGSPAPVGPSLERTRALGLNDGNVRAEYARWRKFNGVSGRIVVAKAAA